MCLQSRRDVHAEVASSVALQIGKAVMPIPVGVGNRRRGERVGRVVEGRDIAKGTLVYYHLDTMRTLQGMLLDKPRDYVDEI